VVRVRNCTAFKSMFSEAKTLAGNLPAAQEAASGLVGKGKLTFTHSKGELDNRAREVLMEVLSNEEVRNIFNKKGEIIGHEPVVPLLEKGKIAASLFLGLHQKAPNFIKNQQNNVVVTGGAADDIDPALLEVFTAVQRSVPMRLVEKGASVQVIAKIEGQDVLVGKVEDGE
jgi:hypothetical protein